MAVCCFWGSTMKFTEISLTQIVRNILRCITNNMIWFCLEMGYCILYTLKYLKLDLSLFCPGEIDVKNQRLFIWRTMVSDLPACRKNMEISTLTDKPGCS